MRQILLAGEESQEWPALLRDLIANRAKQRWIARLECVEDGALRHWAFHLEHHIAADTCQREEMGWEYDSDQH